MPTPAEKQISNLREQINHHNHLYYADARPEISDRAFDALLQKLINLEAAHPELITPDSPTQRVGGSPSSELQTVRHAVPMMSIDNTYSEDEVRAFDQRVKKTLGGETPTYVLEPKIDGSSINLRYENGVLVLAAARGKENLGDDVTANARTIKAVPLRLRESKGHPIPAILEVRGEIYMDNDDFQRVNKEIVAEGDEPYANPRNLTAGTMRRLDPRIVAKRRLRFLAHGLGQVEPLPVESYWEWTERIKAWGLPLPQGIERVDDVDAAIAAIKAFEKTRPKLPYMTDGMVMKVDSFAQREKLGATSKAPRWVIAFKYETEQQQTILKGADWQVGKSGKLTPVGRLEPVFIGGVTVTNATLHNIEQIQRLDLHIGDTVVIERRGEVIPYLVEALTEKRPAHAHAVIAPKKCPSCGSPIEKEEGTPYIYCVNLECPAQLKEQLRWFCGRTQMDIEGLGEKLVDQLVDRGLVRTFADLYALKTEDIATMTSEVGEGEKLVKRTVGEKVAKKVIDGIQNSRQQGLDRLLAGLGINHVGASVARVLANNFGSFDALEAATKEDLSAVDEIGDIIAASVHDYFHDPVGQKIITALKAAEINPTQEVIKPEQAAALPLAGKTIVVTGTLKKLTRIEIEELIVKLGGKASGSVSKKTSFLIAGEEAGSKLTKAEGLGIEILTEDQFLERVGQG